MKYAFILGSNAFITSNGVISYTENGETKEFLRVKSTIKKYPGAPESGLSIDLDLADVAGKPVKLIGDQAYEGGFYLEQTTDRVKFLQSDNKSVIIDVHELSEASVAGLSHHIIAEIEMYDPIAVIRLFGHFKVGNIHVSVDNEKLFIDGNSYAESVHVEHGAGLVMTNEGVAF
jgi:hypothetical protein